MNPPMSGNHGDQGSRKGNHRGTINLNAVGGHALFVDSAVDAGVAYSQAIAASFTDSQRSHKSMIGPKPLDASGAFVLVVSACRSSSKREAEECRKHTEIGSWKRSVYPVLTSISRHPTLSRLLKKGFQSLLPQGEGVFQQPVSHQGLERRRRNWLRVCYCVAQSPAGWRR